MTWAGIRAPTVKIKMPKSPEKAAAKTVRGLYDPPPVALPRKAKKNMLRMEIACLVASPFGSWMPNPRFLVTNSLIKEPDQTHMTDMMKSYASRRIRPILSLVVCDWAISAMDAEEIGERPSVDSGQYVSREEEDCVFVGPWGPKDSQGLILLTDQNKQPMKWRNFCP